MKETGEFIIKKLLQEVKELKKAYGNQEFCNKEFKDDKKSFVDLFLGKIMQDEITGLKGTVTSVNFNIEGTCSVLIIPKLKTGYDSAWVNIDNAKYVDSFITKNND